MSTFTSDKIELAERIIRWLNANGYKMTYGDLGGIIGEIPVAVGPRILDQVNLREKARGGDTVITGCIVNKGTLRPGEGIQSLHTHHGMNVPPNT